MQSLLPSANREIRIADAGFSARTTKTLIAGGFKIVGDLEWFDLDTLVALPNGGQIQAREILWWLNIYGVNTGLPKSVAAPAIDAEVTARINTAWRLRRLRNHM